MGENDVGIGGWRMRWAECGGGGGRAGGSGQGCRVKGKERERGY